MVAPTEILKFTLVTSVTFSCLIAEEISVRFSGGGAAAVPFVSVAGVLASPALVSVEDFAASAFESAADAGALVSAAPGADALVSAALLGASVLILPDFGAILSAGAPFMPAAGVSFEVVGADFSAGAIFSAGAAGGGDCDVTGAAVLPPGLVP